MIIMRLWIIGMTYLTLRIYYNQILQDSSQNMDQRQEHVFDTQLGKNNLENVNDTSSDRDKHNQIDNPEGG